MRLELKTKTKHGASSIFLAIVMSAVILVECTFVAFVWNLDYALGVNTALKDQAETILADYNRQLFSVYGIYAFAIEGIDNECFKKALEINGLTAESELYVSGKQRFTCDDLRKAIDSYYWYRGTGAALRQLAQGYSEMISELDNKGILKNVSQFMRSPAAGYVSKILTGTDTAEQWIQKAGGVLNLDDLVDEVNDINNLSRDYKNAVKDFGLDINADIASWESFLKTLSTLEKTHDAMSSNNPEILTRYNTAHYCAYNFDCHFRPDGDSTINGTDFSSIHEKKIHDCEYIITGYSGFNSVIEVEILMVHVLIGSAMLKDYADEKFRNTMYAIAEVLSDIIFAISEGTINIDPRIIQAGLTFYCAIFQSMKEFWTVVKGGRAVIFEYDGQKIVTYDYRDFLFLFCLLVPEDKLLERALSVLERDYGELYKGITLEADFRGNTYQITKSYRLYD